MNLKHDGHDVNLTAEIADMQLTVGPHTLNVSGESVFFISMPVIPCL